MRDIWYADNRDLIKWGALLHLAGTFRARRIIQIAYFRTSKFGKLVIDGQEQDIPVEVIDHFRKMQDIGRISEHVQVVVFGKEFQDRGTYHGRVITFLQRYKRERCVVLLDPDTGLEPPKAAVKLEHVTKNEARMIWNAMKSGDVFAFYQHGRREAQWIDSGREQLAAALGIQNLQVASGPDIAKDVAIFYTQKPISKD
jgi:hypothetical protein